MYRIDQESAPAGLSPAAEAAGTPARHQELERRPGVGKRWMDVVGALVFLALFSPLFVIIALCVLCSSGGPVIYKQPRVGKNGRLFSFYKFRTMARDSDELLSSFLDSNSAARSQWETYQKLDSDPRITRLGRFLRKSSFDELPQFWNVLRGDMSLVGPRPCVPEQEARYGKHWKAYCSLRPGLTGLWQVSGRNRLSYQQRVDLDARYAQNWSVWLDLKIIAKTFWVVVTAHGSN
jgi:exopolysaccharide production protein ExoY